MTCRRRPSLRADADQSAVVPDPATLTGQSETMPRVGGAAAGEIAGPLPACTWGKYCAPAAIWFFAAGHNTGRPAAPFGVLRCRPRFWSTAFERELWHSCIRAVAACLPLPVRKWQVTANPAPAAWHRRAAVSSGRSPVHGSAWGCLCADPASVIIRNRTFGAPRRASFDFKRRIRRYI